VRKRNVILGHRLVQARISEKTRHVHTVALTSERSVTPTNVKKKNFRESVNYQLGQCGFLPSKTYASQATPTMFTAMY
jgi:hypothetical protein